jgi:hypothetical protein
MSLIRVDHAIYAVDDLDAAASALFEREGLASVPGGRHEGWGTANRIVPLGDSYLELIAVVDEQEAEGSDFGSAVLKGLAEERSLIGWVAATDDIDAVAKRLDLDVERKSRETAGGAELRWRVAGIAEALESGALPFFVQWDMEPELHPGAAGVEHETDPQGIAWIEVAGERERVRDWLGEDPDLPLKIEDGKPGLRAVAIATAGGEIVVR